MKKLFFICLFLNLLPAMGQGYLMQNTTSYFYAGNLVSVFNFKGLAIAQSQQTTASLPKYTLVDWHGNPIDPEKTDSAWFGEKYYILANKGKYGLLSIKGDTLIPFIYTTIQRTFLDSLFIVTDSLQNGKLVNALHQPIISFEYDDVITSAYPPYFQVTIKDKFNMVDKRGKKLLPFDIGDASWKIENQRYVYFLIKNDLGIFDLQRQEVILKGAYNNIQFYEEGYFSVENDKGKFALFDTLGKQILPFQFAEPITVTGNIARIAEDRIGVLDTLEAYVGSALANPHAPKEKYIVNENGISPANCEVKTAIKPIYRKQYSLIRLRDKKIILTDTCRDFSASSLWGGRLVVETSIFTNDTITFEEKPMYRIIDTLGNTLLAPQPQNITVINDNVYQQAEKSGKYTVINKKGKKLRLRKHTTSKYHSESFFIVRKMIGNENERHYYQIMYYDTNLNLIYKYKEGFKNSNYVNLVDYPIFLPKIHKYSDKIVGVYVLQASGEKVFYPCTDFWENDTWGSNNDVKKLILLQKHKNDKYTCYVLDDKGNNITPPYDSLLYKHEFDKIRHFILFRAGKKYYYDYNFSPLKTRYKENKQAVVAKNKLVQGLIDTTGRWVIPAKYETMFFVNDSLFTGKYPIHDNYYVTDLLNDKGEILATYDIIYAIGVKGLSKVVKNNKENFIDSKGKLLFPLQYYVNIEDTRQLYFSLASDDKKSLVDIHGKSVLPTKYEWLAWADKAKGYSFVQLNGKQGIIDMDGKEIIPVIYNSMLNIEMLPGHRLDIENLTKWKESCWVANLNGKYGLIDKQGKVIVPFKHSYAGYYDLGYYIFPEKKHLVAYRIDGSIFNETFSDIYGIEHDSKYMGVRYRNRYGIIDTANHWLIAPTFKTPIIKWTDLDKAIYILTMSETPLYTQKVMGVTTINYLPQIALNRKGKILAEKHKEKVDMLEMEKDILFAPIAGKNKFNIIDSTGKAITIKGKFGRSHGTILVYETRKDGQYNIHIIDKQGNKISDIYEDNVYNGVNEKPFFIVATQTGKKGTISAEGKEIIPPIYDCFNQEKGLSIIKVCVGEKVGFIDETGKIIIPIQYDAASNFSEGLCVVSIGKKVGCIDSLGNVVLPLQYEGVVILGRNLFAINQNCLWQLIRRNGELAHNEYFKLVRKGEDRMSFTHGGIDTYNEDNFYATLDKEELKIIDTGNNILLVKAKIAVTDQKNAYILHEKGKYGIVSLDFKEVILPCEYDDIYLPPNFQVDKPVISLKKEGLFGLMVDGKVTLPPQYHTIIEQSTTLLNTRNTLEILPYFRLIKGNETHFYYYREGSWHLK